jgi:hypothetical protein
VEISQQKRVYCSPQNARALLLKIFRYTPTFANPKDFGVRTNGCQLSQLIAVGRLADPVQALGQLLVIRINNPVGWMILLAPDTNCGPSAVVAHNEDPNDIANDTKQEMIREPL